MVCPSVHDPIYDEQLQTDIWSTWSSWSDCSKTCFNHVNDVGLRRRFYNCNISISSLTSNISSSSHIHNLTLSLSNLTPITSNHTHVIHPVCAAVDGGWSDWSRWSPCSSQCGSGEQTRDRLCNSPAPQHGGLSCSGPHIQSRDCGVYHRLLRWLSLPSGTVPVQQQLCVCSTVSLLPPGGDIPLDCNWSIWTQWSSCSRTCDVGVRRRYRSGTNPAPAFGGLPCSGDRVGIDSCTPGCRVDGAWGQWGPWTGCSLSCGGGEKLRKRLCDNPPPEGGARGCVGVAEQQKACNTQQCTGDSGGPWWSWSQWSVCSVSCGGGQQARSQVGCPPGKLYRECDGDGCPFSCSQVSGAEGCYSDGCEEGCHCPPLTYQHNGVCLQVGAQSYSTSCWLL
uniref:Uncharacterized protein n=1 Tax=Gouania willdenowi TaxID=441366 RepID=A0A8C5EVT8_GOUWI